jgi:hypothetical protein
LLVSVAADVIAVAVLVCSRSGAAGYAAAGAIHLLAVGAVWIRAGARNDAYTSRLVMATALVLILPMVGAVVAMLEQATAGREEIAQFFTPADVPSPTLTAAGIQRLTHGLSPSEALQSDNPEERRNTLGLLARRADNESIGLLRWAVGGANAELAVEAALTLEDLSVGFEARAASCRLALHARPCLETALAVADILAEVIHIGLADPVMLAPQAAESRKYSEPAATFAGERWPEVAARWARLEQSALRPDKAAEILARTTA